MAVMLWNPQNLKEHLGLGWLAGECEDEEWHEHPRRRKWELGAGCLSLPSQHKCFSLGFLDMQVLQIRGLWFLAPVDRGHL